MFQENIIFQDLLGTLANKEWNIIVEKLVGEFNFHADGLAKLGATQNQFKAFGAV